MSENCSNVPGKRHTWGFWTVGNTYQGMEDKLTDAVAQKLVQNFLKVLAGEPD